MSDERNEEREDQAATAAEPQAAEADTAGQPEAPESADATPKPQPISIDLDELTEEGRKKVEESLGRPVNDIPYTLASQDRRPGSILALRFEVTAPDYQAEQTRQLEDLRKETTLPGFRRGKAPLKLIQIRLGDEAARGTVGSVAVNVLRQENAKQEFKFIAKPQVVDYTTPKDDSPLTIEIESEIEPVVELKEYKGFTVEVEDHPVADEAVNERLETLRRQNAVVEPAPDDATLAESDTAVVDVDVLNARGERMANLSSEGRTITNLAQLPEPIAKALPGKKVGEVVEADVESSTTNRRGEQVSHVDHYKVSLRQIRRERLPELDDEFAKDLGDHETLAALRESVRKELEQAEADRQRGEAVNKIYGQMIAKNPVDAPRTLMAREQYQMIQRDSYQLQRMGLRLEHVVHDTAQYISDQRAASEMRVKLQLLLHQLAKDENIEVNDADVEAEIARLAERSGRKPLAVRARLEATRELDSLRDSLLVRKIEDLLLGASTVNKVEPKPPEQDEKAEPAAEETAEKPGEKPAKKTEKKTEKKAEKPEKKAEKPEKKTEKKAEKKTEKKTEKKKD